MAFTDAGGNRRIIQGICPVQITLAGTVNAGDPIMYDSGWKLSTNTSGKPAILIAGQRGLSTQIITAYVAAIIELAHTAANVPTMGQQLAVADAGTYDATVGSTYQDIGYVISIDTSDSLHSLAYVSGFQVALDEPGT